MDLELKNKVIMVTGGAKGIGAAIVNACAAEGAIPVIVGRDAEAGKRVQAELHNRGAKCDTGVSTPEAQVMAAAHYEVVEPKMEAAKLGRVGVVLVP